MDLPRFYQRVRARDAAVFALTALAIFGLGMAAWRLAPVLLLIFGGVLVAILFRTLADGMSRWLGLSYGWALGLALLLLTAGVSAGLYLGGHLVANQLAELSDQIPRSLEKLRKDLSASPWGRQLLRAAPTSTEEVPVKQEVAASYATGALYSVTQMLAAALVVLFLGVYLAIDPDKYSHGALRQAPPRHRPRLLEVMGEIHHKLRWWLLGQLLCMLIIGVATTIGLALLGVPLALALGVIAAVLAFIPNFGPVISAVPAVLLAFVLSPLTALYVVILYLALQTVESYLITPLIEQHVVSIPPVLTISAQVGMGLLFGVGGVIVATPLVAAAQVAITRLYIEDALESELVVGDEFLTPGNQQDKSLDVTET
jgi:predicted PurR-regulated permease PerM